MDIVRGKIPAIVVGLMVACAGPATAWGPDGHRIVCRIAYQLLDCAASG
jgi:hypothetical protein